MLLSLSANPVPSDLYHFIVPGSKSWLPWYVWGGGVYATKYGYDTTKYIGYMGTVSVPIETGAGASVTINSLRVVGSVEGKLSNGTEGAMLLVRLSQRTGNLSSAIATIMVDRRTVAVSNVYIDITQSAGGFLASPSANSLGIEIIGEGQGLATVTALILNLSY